MVAKPSKLATLLRQGYQGATLGFGDELIDYSVAPIVAALTNQKVSDVLKQAREMSAMDLASDSSNPKTALLANLLGSAPVTIASSPRVLAQAGLGAVQGFGSGTGNANDRLDEAAIGGAFGLGGQALAKGVSRISKGASDLIAPEVRKTAQKLKAIGVPVRLSQLMDSKFLSAVDMALSKVPFSGAGKSQEAQRKAFTKALSNTFGENADTITSDVMGAARDRLSGEYDRLLANQDIPIDRQAFAQTLSQLVGDLSLETDGAGAAFLAKQAENILNTIDNNGGMLTGKSYQKLRQTLKGAKGTNFSVGQIQKLVDDAVRNSVPDNIGAQLGDIDSQYRNMKITEKLYGQLQNSSGQIKPETLYNAAKPNISDIAYGGGGEMGDLARAGRVLRPTIPDTGTATQLMGGGVLAGATGGAYFNPALALSAAGVVGGSNLLNRAMTSNYLQEGMSPAIQAATQKIANSKIVPSVLRAANSSQNESTYSPEQDQQLQNMMNGYNPDNDPDFQKFFGQTQQIETPYNPDEDPEFQKIFFTSDLSPPMRTGGNIADRIRQAESGGDPNARNPMSSASGLYQLTDGTWDGLIKNYPDAGLQGYNKNDPRAQEIAMGLLMNENKNAYKKAGISPSDADLYAAHFLGAPSAVKAKKNPQMYGAQMLPKAAKANPTIFYNNGKPRTNAEIYSVLADKVGV